MLKPDELKALRRLLDKAGGEKALYREIRRAKQLPKRGRGRPVRDASEYLEYFELACRMLERDGILRQTALRAVVGHNYNLHSKAADAAAHGIARKLRDPEFQERFDDRLCRSAETFPGQFTALKRVNDRSAGSSEANRRKWAATFKR